MAITCSVCHGWCEIVYDQAGGLYEVNYCPLCGADLKEHPPRFDEDDEEETP